MRLRNNASTIPSISVLALFIPRNNRSHTMMFFEILTKQFFLLAFIYCLVTFPAYQQNDIINIFYIVDVVPSKYKSERNM